MTRLVGILNKPKQILPPRSLVPGRQRNPIGSESNAAGLRWSVLDRER